MGGCASRAVTRAPSSLDCRGKQHSAVIASLDCRAVQQTGAIHATDRLGEGSKSWVVTPHVLQDALRCISCGLLMSGLLLGAGASASAAEEDSMQPQYYLQQVQDAMPLKTMRGVWRFKEKREGRTCTGRLTFQGKLDEPNRGDVVYENLEGGAAMCYSPTPPAKAVKGKWLMKPAKFESKVAQNAYAHVRALLRNCGAQPSEQCSVLMREDGVMRRKVQRVPGAAIALEALLHKTYLQLVEKCRLPCVRTAPRLPA